MKVVAVGDNCVDVYYTMNRFYPTGNAVDFAIMAPGRDAISPFESIGQR